MTKIEKIEKAVELIRLRGYQDVNVITEHIVSDVDEDGDGKLDDESSGGTLVVDLGDYPEMREDEFKDDDDILDIYELLGTGLSFPDPSESALSDVAVQAVAHAWTLGYELGHIVQDGKIVLDANRNKITADQVNRADNVSSAFRIFGFESR